MSKLHSRKDLKKFFRNGGIPTENHFSDLIDSMINRQDDGLSKNDKDGLILYSSKSSKKLITLFKAIDDLGPFFFVEKDEQETEALCFKPAKGNEKQQEKSSFYFHVNGSLGVGKRSDAGYSLDVNGFAAMKGRVGTFLEGEIEANGRWQTITDELDNCQAFEVMARTGKMGSGKYAILHAYALSAFGGSKSKIRKTCAYYGFFWNKINIRWKSTDTHHYVLQLRTNCNYGEGIFIDYKVTQLWDDKKFLSNDHFYNSQT